MLDEIVGFNEQGFSLYIMSFWNAFDLGILLLLICYYGMRLYGILMPAVRKHPTADRAYDLLAANAVLLFPRLFSVLDHSRYFSQLLIAFRMMAVDLVAVFTLIVICCSGFFVAFTLSLSSDKYDGRGVAYALFQILMGFTPAAWDAWSDYNLLGKIILTLFLFICHFLIVTILITVLTNSFMAIVQNANEEHQFVFAVNAISMVKSDALFSYIAPTNIIAWFLTPLRFIVPFRQFVKINRTVIKVTHFPILLAVYVYERIILRGASFEPSELIEPRGRTQSKDGRVLAAGLSLFSPKVNRLREPSVATFQKDRALAEVFRRPFRDNTIRNTQRSMDRRKTSNVVSHWMHGMGPNGTASPPLEQDRSVVDRLEARKLAHSRSQLLQRRPRTGRSRDVTAATLSVMSDPEEFFTTSALENLSHHRENSGLPSMSVSDIPHRTDGDGDDELVTNDEDEYMTLDQQPTPISGAKSNNSKYDNPAEDYFQHTPVPTPRKPTPLPKQTQLLSPPVEQRVSTATQTRSSQAGHRRQTSTNTIIHDPIPYYNESSSSPSRKATTAKNSAKNAVTGDGAMTPASAGRRTPKRQMAKPRPIMPPRTTFQSAPNLAGMLMLDSRRPRDSSFAMELGSDLGDNKAVGGGFVGAVPSSFATQMAYATGAMRAGQAAAEGHDDQQRMNKLMLARFNQLEEGFREVIKEVKDWRRDDVKSADDRSVSRAEKVRAKRTGKKGGNMRRGLDREEDAWVDENEAPQGEKGSSI